MNWLVLGEVLGFYTEMVEVSILLECGTMNFINDYIYAVCHADCGHIWVGVYSWNIKLQ